MSEENQEGSLDFLLKKFQDKTEKKIAYTIEFIEEFLQDTEKIDFFREKIKERCSKGNYPFYNLTSMLSIIAEILNKKEEPLKSKIFDFTLNLFDSSKENHIILGFEIFSENRKLFWEKREEFYSRIIPYWDSPSEKIKAEAICCLRYYVYADFRYFSFYINKLKEILIRTENCFIIISSITVLGVILLYNYRVGEVQYLDIREVNQIFAKFQYLKTVSQKETFLNGLEFLLLDYDKYESSWIEFYFNEYTNSTLANTEEELFYQSQLLSNIVTLPNKKRFCEDDSKKYSTFFNESLEVLLKPDYVKSSSSSLLREFHFRHIVHNREQLTFYLPEVVEQLLPLYEEVYSKYFPEQVIVNSGIKVAKLDQQWMQQIYVILSNYYKERRNYNKSSIYYKKVADYTFNNKQRYEFLIKHYQDSIGYEIKNRNLPFIKNIFNKLNEVFERYKELFAEIHICYSI